MKSVGRTRTVGRGIGQRIDDLELLDDRTRPSMRDDERHRVLMLRANVDEVNIQSIDLGHEVRQRIELRLALAPIVISRPMAREVLNHRERHALRVVGDSLPVRPSRCLDPSPQVDELRFRHMYVQWTNRCLVAAQRGGNISDSLVRFCKSKLAQRARSNGCRCHANETTP